MGQYARFSPRGIDAGSGTAGVILREVEVTVGGLAFRLFFDTRIDTFLQTHLDWPLHMFAIYPNRMDRLR